MSIRERLTKNPSVAVGFAVALVVVAGVVMFVTLRAPARPDTSKAFFSDDDGQTWFADDAYRVPPFDHNGRPAVSAVVFTYADGRKTFCGYLTRFTPDGQRRLSTALADAKAKGRPPATVSLFTNPSFLRQCMEVRSPGPGKPWVPYADPKAQDVISVHAPDGSMLDQAVAG